MKANNHLDKREKRLNRSIGEILNRADHSASTRISTEADKAAAEKGQFGHAGHAAEVSRITSQELDKVWSEIVTTYNAERSALWFRQQRLDWVVTAQIQGFFDESHRRVMEATKAIGMGAHRYQALTDERRKLALGRLETHYRHPGLLPPHQRYAIAFALIMMGVGAIVGAVLTTMGRVLFR